MNSRIKIGLLTLGLLATASCHAEELGRLFFTPVQRAQLETGNLQSDGSSGNGTVTINGIVQRHGGGRTAWINGVSKPAGASDDASPDSLPLTLPGQTRPTRVKVGQKIIVTPSVTPDQPATPEQ